MSWVKRLLLFVFSLYGDLTQENGEMVEVMKPLSDLTLNNPLNLKSLSENFSFKYVLYVVELNGYIFFLYDSGV